MKFINIHVPLHSIQTRVQHLPCADYSETQEGSSFNERVGCECRRVWSTEKVQPLWGSISLHKTSATSIYRSWIKTTILGCLLTRSIDHLMWNYTARVLNFILMTSRSNITLENNLFDFKPKHSFKNIWYIFASSSPNVCLYTWKKWTGFWC